MRGGIPGVEEETYFSSYLDSPGQGTGVHSVFVKPGKISIFQKKGKTVISIENRKFYRSRMTKRIALLNSSHKI